MSGIPAAPLVVTGKRMLTSEVCEFELGSPDGAPLPLADAGAHIEVTTPGGPVRSYSLTGDTLGGSHYRIAVHRSPTSEGGSRSMVDDVSIGDELLVTAPSNTFALEPSSGYLLVAAGIGITPIRAMAHELVRRGAADVRLVYLARTPAETAYLEEIAALDPHIPVTIHHRDGGERFDLWRILADPGERRLYCCGPDRLQDEVRALTMHWRPSRVHFERFGALSSFGMPALAFTARWQPTGVEIEVAAETSLLTALRAEGIEVDSSCESGTCGTCILRLVSGRADHRDVALSEEQRNSRILPCVSRALDDEIVVAPV